MAKKSNGWNAFFAIALILIFILGFYGAFRTIDFPEQEEQKDLTDYARIGSLFGSSLEGLIANKECTEFSECEECEECVGSSGILGDYLDQGVEDFMGEVEEDEELRICDNLEYDFEEIENKKVWKYWNVEILNSEEYKVSFKIKLRYQSEFLSIRCHKIFDVEVSYEEGEEPEIEILE